MRNETGRVIGILVVVLTAIVAVESVALLSVTKRVSKLEISEEAGSVENGTPLTIAREVDEIRLRLNDVSKAVEEQGLKTQNQIAKIERVANEAVNFSVERSGGEASSMNAANLEEAVAKAVEEKLEELPKMEGGEWKPSMQQFTEKLELNEFQAMQAEKIIDDAKAELFTLASLKREDGTSKMDDLVTAVTDPDDPEKAMKGWFMSLFTEKIPGREETYLADILRSKEKAKNALVEILDEQQSKKMLRLNVDYFGVKTEYDPFGEYIQEAVR